MATELKWTRVGPGSGPGNVLNGRYRVERAASDRNRWCVRDMETDRFVALPGHLAHWSGPTMAEARRFAVQHVLSTEESP